MTSPVTHSLLVVEDSDDDFFALKRALKKAGFNQTLIRCVRGDEVVPLLTDYADQPFSLILLDLNLPAISGHDVLKMIKNDESLRATPVVVLSVSRNPTDVVECYIQGASSYVEKAIDFAEFSQSIKQLCDYWFGVVVLPEPKI